MDSQRTCFTCRQKEKPDNLLRFVRALDGEIIFDVKAVLPTRGLWLCAERTCISAAFDRKKIFKGEKVILPTSSQMIDKIRSSLRENVKGRLGLLRRLGQCEAGRDAAKNACRTKDALMVIYASDLSARSLQEAKTSCASAPLFNSYMSMDEMGKCLGRKKTGVVALLKSRISLETKIKIEMLARMDG